MKGMVFNIFSDMVNDTFGLEVWDALIESTQPASNAIYTSTELYPDEELMAYVAELSRVTGTPAPDLVRAFGKFMMLRFGDIHPEFLQGHTAKSMLQGVNDVIHVEVKKLHPNSLLPSFRCESPVEDRLIMFYESPRKLCHLAEGLIDGTGEVFGEQITVEHTQCMHRGADSCKLELTFGH